MKMLFLDIETAPAEVLVFQTFKPIIGMDQIIAPSRIICWSARWYDGKKTEFMSEYHHDYQSMLDGMHRLMDEADIVVTYNGRSFDVPWLTGEFILNQMSPPSPFQHIDLYQIAKSNTRLLSRKLDYLSLRLLGDRKISHSGFNLWKDCLGYNGPEPVKAAWTLMKKYSLKDTELMIPLYDILRPWMRQHPNIALIDGSIFACPKCGSENVQKRGYSVTGASRFQRFQCNDCGGWSKDAVRLDTTALRSI